MGIDELRAWKRKRIGQRVVCGIFVLFVAATQVHAGSVSYTYDSLGRMATVTYNNGTTTTTITYSYDAAGNRTSVVTTSP